MGKVSYNQSGYVGQSMSVRAREAYESGEMPLSKWTKRAMLDAWEEYAAETGASAAVDPRMLTKKELSRYLAYSSWHHTGKYAARTNFYRFDGETFAAATWQDINEQREIRDR